MKNLSDWRTRVGELPILQVVPSLLSSLESCNAAVLAAPPGAGKTTVVPLALLDAAWLGDKRIIMLEPRRLAARAAARRMASLLAQSVGRTVGYRIRNDTQVGDNTRIEVVTEGVLTRMLQSDPMLADYGIVIFDEFHERNLHGDLGIALVRHAQRIVRSDLRLLVMSATLDTDRISRFLGDAPVVASEGRSWPIANKYFAPRAGQPIEGAATGAIVTALRDTEGDILVFLPGIGEISRVASALQDREELRDVAVHMLHSSTPPEEQDAAIAPSPVGRRKVVLSSAIAETSLTIEGVRVVIDSGLSRVPRYSPRTGLTRLETVRVSKASATQRAGRAGRTSPGVCYRLWLEHEQDSLMHHWLPEIMDADLVPLALDLAAAGVSEVADLDWLDAPPAAAFATARSLLQDMNAIDAEGRITSHGVAMNRLALHPRLAHMVIRSRELRLTALACDVAALLGERDVIHGDGRGEDVDMRTRVHLLNRFVKTGLGSGVDRAISANVDRPTLERVAREATRLRRATDAGNAPGDERATGLLLAFAYPDRIARSRDTVDSRFLLLNGAGAALPMTQALSASEFIVAVDLDGRKPESRIWLAAPVDQEDLRRNFAELVTEGSSHEWDEKTSSVRLVMREKLGRIVLRERVAAPIDPDATLEIVLAKLAESQLTLFNWTESARSLQSRVEFLRHHGLEYPDLSDAGLISRAAELLAPYLVGVSSSSALRKVDIHAILSGAMQWKARAAIDELAPTHIVVPTGTRVAVDYSDVDSPVASVRLQEVFGLVETPRVLGGKVPVTLQLLSPARRPVQVTRDLAGFWKTSYREVRKDMRGRYPKHPWPEDPAAAAPTRGVKKG